MSTQTRLKAAEIEQRRAAASKDIEQREKENLRSFIPSFPRTQIKLNDPSWYKKFAPSETVVSLPNFVPKTIPVPNTVVGLTQRELVIDGSPTDTVKSIFPLASVVVHHYLPHIGKVMDTNKDYLNNNDIEREEDGVPEEYPINIALLRDLMQLGKFNSRTVIPDPSIMGFYVISGTDLYAVTAKLGLALSVALHFESTDITIPRSILSGLGFSYDGFIVNIKEWRAIYQECVSILNSSIPMPTNLTFFSRRMWLSKTIVKSTESSLSPIQVFDQVAYGTVSPDATRIDYSAWYNRTRSNYPFSTPSNFRSWFKSAVNALLLNEEICTFIANLRAGVPAEKFYLMDVELPKEISIPMLDEVRLIIQNMIILPLYQPRTGLSSDALLMWDVQHDVDGNVFQIGRIDYYRPYFNKFQKSFNAFRPMDGDQYLVASRLKVSVIAGLDGFRCIKSCGTEVMIGSELYLTGPVTNILMYATDINAYYDINKTVIADLLDSELEGITGVNFLGMFERYHNCEDLTYYQNSFVDDVLASYAKCIDGCFEIKFVAATAYEGRAFYGSVDLKEVDYFVPVSETELNYINDLCLKSLYYLSDDDFRSSFNANK